jgi:hypothetical protein
MPLVSIVTAVFNTRRFLAERFRSILRQSCGDWEWILIDDGSTDGSLDELHRLAGGDRRIKIFDNGRNLGFTETCDRGIKIATGEFLYRADSDDSCQLDFLQTLTKALREHPTCALASSSTGWLDERDRLLVRRRSPQSKVITGATASRRLICGNFLCAPSLIYRMEAIRHTAGFAAMPTLRVNSDWLLSLQLLAKGSLLETTQTVGYYRRAKSGLSLSSIFTSNPSDLEREVFGLINWYKEWPGQVLGTDERVWYEARLAGADMIASQILLRRSRADRKVFLEMIRRHVPTFSIQPRHRRRLIRSVLYGLALNISFNLISKSVYPAHCV